MYPFSIPKFIAQTDHHTTTCNHGHGFQDGIPFSLLVVSIQIKWVYLICFDLDDSMFDLQATTGMCVTEECKSSFMEMKWKKVHRYIVFKIDEGSRLVTVDKVGGPGESYDDLAASLPEDDCRYAVFDFDFVTVDNCRKSKIFFIAWSVTHHSGFSFFSGSGP